MENDIFKYGKNKETLDSELFNFLSDDLNVSIRDITGKIDNF